MKWMLIAAALSLGVVSATWTTSLAHAKSAGSAASAASASSSDSTVNWNDPNLAQGSGFASDMTANCLDKRGNAEDLDACLNRQTQGNPQVNSTIQLADSSNSGQSDTAETASESSSQRSPARSPAFRRTAK